MSRRRPSTRDTACLATGRRSVRERGAAAVEFAIVLPLVLLLIGGIVDFGRMMFYQQLLSNAAQQGARTVAIGYSQGTAGGQIVTATNAVSGGVTVAYAYSAGDCPNEPGPNDTVRVTVSTNNFEWLVIGAAVGFFGGSTPAPTLHASSTMRCGG